MYLPDHQNSFFCPRSWNNRVQSAFVFLFSLLSLATSIVSVAVLIGQRNALFEKVLWGCCWFFRALNVRRAFPRTKRWLRRPRTGVWSFFFSGTTRKRTRCTLRPPLRTTRVHFAPPIPFHLSEVLRPNTRSLSLSLFYGLSRARAPRKNGHDISYTYEPLKFLPKPKDVSSLSVSVRTILVAYWHCEHLPYVGQIKLKRDERLMLKRALIIRAAVPNRFFKRSVFPNSAYR